MMIRDAIFENAIAVRIVTPVHGVSLLSGFLRNGWKTVCLWHDRAQQRRQLLTLDAHMLQDIGIQAEGQVREGMKPFWKP